MNVLATESKLWWLSVADEIRAPRGTPIIETVRMFGERFQFSALPTSLPGTAEGYKFLEGATVVRDMKVAIKEVTIFNDGISVEIYSDTDDLLATLEQILAFLQGLGMREPKTPPNIVFNSRLVVELDGNINKLIAPYESLNSLMVEIFGTHGTIDTRLLEFQMDPKLGPPLNPTTFRIERRTNTGNSQNRFFSFANATTKNHIRLLERIETSFAN